MKLISNFFIHLGKSLMLPIATLPVAGILLRLGQPDLLDIPFMAIAGDSVFKNLPVIFAIGVAIGFAKDGHGAAALSGFVGHVVFLSALLHLLPGANLGVLSGILIGAIAGTLYNRYHAIALPTYLAFFGGRRFVPIITGIVSLILAFVFSFIWGPIGSAISALGNWIIASNNLGLFVYGFANRMLVPVGLHHILNSLVWFEFGSFVDATGAVVKGDLWRFFASDKTAGGFMSFAFPVMMFGLPGGALAMILSAPANKRKMVTGILVSSALTGFLTGITEPIEFAFMFVAFPLYVMHAVLTGLSGVIMNVFNVKLGFTFSAGAFDYLLNFGLATNPLYLIPIGIVYFIVYFVLFYIAIKLFNLKTLGREDDTQTLSQNINVNEDGVGELFVKALGGTSNLLAVDNCTTRLRLDIVDKTLVNEAHLKELGAKGVVHNAQGKVQVVIGPEVELIANKIKLFINKVK